MFTSLSVHFQDACGSSADSPDTPIIQAVKKIRSAYPDLLVACDVCLCAYTDHGHCGKNVEEFLNDKVVIITRTTTATILMSAVLITVYLFEPPNTAET